MTEKVAGSLPKNGHSRIERDSDAHIIEASSSADGPVAYESKDSVSRTDGEEVEVPGSGLSRADGPGQGYPSPGASGGTLDGEAVSDNASLSSDDATPIANGSVADLDWAQPVISSSALLQCRPSHFGRQKAYTWYPVIGSRS